MKNLIAFLAFVMLSHAHAQAPAAQIQVVQPQAPIVAQAQPAQPKKTLIYDERTNQLVEVAPQAQAAAPTQVEAQATANAPTGAPIYILNNQKLQGYQSAVQEAPTQVVQEAPVKNSVSETIRRERVGAEAATEDGIVQTLEKARLDDEMRRREKFNSALGATVSGSTTAVAAPSGSAPAAAQAATTSNTTTVNAPGAQNVITTTTATTEQNEVVEVAPQQPQRPTKSKRKKVVLEDATETDYHSEVRTAIVTDVPERLNLTQYYISGQVGAANYSAANIRSKLASGFSLGMVTPERFVFEGSFMYSQNEIDNIAGYQANGMTYDFSQYNFSAAAKYQLLPGKLRPTVGGILSYTHRSYSVADGYGYYGSYGGNSDLGTTDAIDGGLEAGLDLMLTNNFAIGADFRYLWNIATKDAGSNSYRYGYSNSYQRYLNGGIPDVEDLGYYIASISAKFTF